ncbi:17064_t:CDS:1, partial [Racocetra fulgida]
MNGLVVYFLLIAVLVLLVVIFVYLAFYLPQSKSQEISSLEEKIQLRLDNLVNHQKESGQQQEKLLQLRWEQLEKELKANKEGLTQQQKEQENLLKTHLESL